MGYCKRRNDFGENSKTIWGNKNKRLHLTVGGNTF